MQYINIYIYIYYGGFALFNPLKFNHIPHNIIQQLYGRGWIYWIYCNVAVCIPVGNSKDIAMYCIDVGK